jgi:ABC-type transporter Mla subunit MlaD
MGPLLSGGPQPRPRWRDDDDGGPIPMIGRPATPPAPMPSAVELLAQLIEQQAAAERAAVQRHAEVLARLDAQDRRLDALARAVAAVDDTAGLARSDIEDLHRYVGEGFEVVMEALNEVADVVAPLDDDES